MYNGIGLQTARGSGTNGFVQRNLSCVRKTKERIVEYDAKEDSAVRPFDIELIEHEKRRQVEVKCLELQELLEEKDVPEDEIQEKVDAFRAKLMANKNSLVIKDSSGRPMLKDSHEISKAQEEKNAKVKAAFGIREGFVPGSSMETNLNKAKEKKAAEEVQNNGQVELPEAKVQPEEPKKDMKKKKSKKRRASSTSSSSSSSSSSSDDERERRHKKRSRKDKKKKSKKSHHHKRAERSRSREKHSNSCDDVECDCCRCGESTSSYGCLTQYSIHSSSCDEEEHFSSENEDSSYNLTSANCFTIVNYGSTTNTNSHSVPIQLISLTVNPTTPEQEITQALVGPTSIQISPVNINNTNRNASSSKQSHSKSRSKSPIPNGKHNHSRSKSKSKSLSKSPSPPLRSRSDSRSLSRSPSRSNYSRSSIDSRRSSRSRSRSVLSHDSRSVSSFGSHRSLSRSSSSSSTISRSRSRSRGSSRQSFKVKSRSRSRSSRRSSRSLSIPRRRGSPSFLDRRRITSARKRPIPYTRRPGSEYDISSETSSDSDSSSDSNF